MLCDDIFFIDDGFLRNIAKEADLVFDFFGEGLFAAAEDDIGHDSDLAQSLHRVLGRLGLHFAGSLEKGDIGQVDVDAVFWPLVAELADRFKKGEGFDISYGAADFDEDDLDRLCSGSRRLRCAF